MLLQSSQQVVLDVPQLLREVDIVVVRIFKSFDLVPQGIYLLFAVAANLLDVRQLINQLALAEDGLKHLLCRHIFQCALFPGCQRVKDGQGDRILGIQLLVVDTDIIRYCLTDVYKRQTLGLANLI